MDKIKLDLGDRSYDIVVGSELVHKAEKYIKPLLLTPKVIIVTDKNVATHHLNALQNALDTPYETIILPAGEQTKSFSHFENLLDRLLAFKPDRDVTLIAFGGGVIGDITGFAASVLLRGVNFIQIPTTLLAMVDSSVGGKTGINTKYGKNLIGSFYQPKLVLADISLLKTLPKREFLAGYAEAVKYGLINDPEFFEDLCNAAGDFSDDFIKSIVYKSCKAKAGIVAEDELEGGKRALLNLGHTFGHALEAESNYKLLHGEAVSVGMVMAFQFSEYLGLCKKEDVEKVISHLSSVGLPTSMDDLGKKFKPKNLLAHMMQDKKNKDGKLTFILTNGIGKSFVCKDVTDVSLFFTSVYEF